MPALDTIRLKIVKCVLILEGAADELRLWEDTLEGQTMGAAERLFSFAYVLPPPGDLRPHARRRWCLEHWGTPAEPLASAQYANIEMNDDAIAWRLATLDRPPDEAAEEIAYVSGLKVRLGSEADDTWRIAAWDGPSRVATALVDLAPRDRDRARGMVRGLFRTLAPGALRALDDWPPEWVSGSRPGKLREDD